MERAKLFKNGGSQAVRLPKAFAFPGDQEVIIRREGTRIILEPVDEWPADFLKCLGAWDEELERPEQVPLERARDPFGD